jgi:hypothetical protein
MRETRFSRDKHLGTEGHLGIEGVEWMPLARVELDDYHLSDMTEHDRDI